MPKTISAKRLRTHIREEVVIPKFPNCEIRGVLRQGGKKGTFFVTLPRREVEGIMANPRYDLEVGSLVGIRRVSSNGKGRVGAVNLHFRMHRFVG